MCVHRSLAGLSPLSVTFAQEPDELWQAGLCGSSAHGSPDQSTAMFDRDAEKVPGDTREPSVTQSQRPRVKPLHSVNFLNGAHGHSRGVLAEQLLQRPESGKSTQCDSHLSAHGNTGSFTWRRYSLLFLQMAHPSYSHVLLIYFCGERGISSKLCSVCMCLLFHYFEKNIMYSTTFFS